jgi:hypothetical protein
VPSDVQRLGRLLDPVISDPFIPDEIRSAVVDLLDNRIQVLGRLYSDEFEKYSNNLAKREHEPLTKLDDINEIHNKIVEQQRLRGCGIAQIEEEVQEIRDLIRDYFDPHLYCTSLLSTVSPVYQKSEANTMDTTRKSDQSICPCCVN